MLSSQMKAGGLDVSGLGSSGFGHLGFWFGFPFLKNLAI